MLSFSVDTGLPESDLYYLQAYINNIPVLTDSPTFSIKHAGLDIITPTVSTIWVRYFSGNRKIGGA